jgi:hypothetical protein
MVAPKKPNDWAKFLPCVPEIEERIQDLNPHAIVMGLGPSAWLIKKIDQRLLDGVRLFGVNDVFKIRGVHDLVIMDHPVRELHRNSERHKTVVRSRPDRLWLYYRAAPHWQPFLADEVKEVQRTYNLNLLNKNTGVLPKLTDKEAYSHLFCSPCGTTCIAWGEGMRRIGVIGVDLIPGTHVTSRMKPDLDWFFQHISTQARILGGEIANLSPISSVVFEAKEPVKP